MFVVIMPNSKSNPTDQYRVCDSDDWMKFHNGAALSYAFTEHETYIGAEKARDEANKALN